MFAMVFIVGSCDRNESTPQNQRAGVGGAGLAKELILDLGDGVGMKLVLIPAGRFTMGSPETEKGRMPDEYLREVVIAEPFYTGVYPVTVDQFSQFMKNTRTPPKGLQWPTDPSLTGDYPASGVSWDDAQAFCRWMSWKTGKTVALPTHEQWEYACRAGSTTAYYFGDDESQLADYAWFLGNANGVPQPVGKKKPNAWGLYDMLGNVSEWCESYCSQWGKGPNDLTAAGGIVRDGKVLCGGHCAATPERCRSAHFSGMSHDYRHCDDGFRVVVHP
jgi:formylglycine-generating enzyme required for sulfatase activity